MTADDEAAARDEAVRADSAVPFSLTSDEILGRVETGVIVVDHDGSLRYANSFAAHLFGFPDPAHLTDVPFRHLGFHEEEIGKVENLEYQACRGRDWEGTLAMRRPDKSNYFVRMNAVPLRDSSGDVAGTVIMAKEAVLVGASSSAGRAGLLDRIGERLGGSLALGDTLERVADTLVPQFADHCFIDLRTKEGLVRRVLANAWDWTPTRGRWAAIGELVRYPPGHFCSRAMAQGETILIEDLHDEDQPAQTAAALEASREAGMTSVIAAPLTMRGELLGVMTLALSNLTERTTRHYIADDRDLVAAIASRVSVAVDNAMLFEEERATALAFQNSLLPAKPPELDGLEVAYRYVPAKPLETHGQGIQTQVGGDWYDIIPLSAGRVGIVIGDVEGRGARAAAIMGQLRSALRAFAQDDKAPADIMRRLDDWCRTMTEEGGDQNVDPPTASCTYLIYDPWTRRLSIANAGHMSPLIISDGDVGQMELKYEGVLLGVGLPTYREESRTLDAGSTLIFYTDGLVDRRQRDDGPGHYDDAEVLDMLRAAIKRVATQNVDKVAQAAENAVPGEIDDDMAILVVRTDTQDLPSWDLLCPAEPIRVSEARRMAFGTFVECGMDAEQADLACLLVSEVVTNVVLHTAAAPAPPHEFAFGAVGKRSGGVLEDWIDAPFAEDFAGVNGDTSALAGQEFRLRIRKGRNTVWVEVFDSDLRLPRIRLAGENDEGGRGLYLVDQLASRWGSRPTEDGKAVWFEMPIRA
ncbi:MAG TPA: SpoIIE family protein phosphatase [Streptosporangiaceae bacterium]|nr:SpoIIE family protein phosphatase [Streptosporangiaceae bacterium]